MKSPAYALSRRRVMGTGAEGELFADTPPLSAKEGVAAEPFWGRISTAETTDDVVSLPAEQLEQPYVTGVAISGMNSVSGRSLARSWASISTAGSLFGLWAVWT